MIGITNMWIELYICDDANIIQSRTLVIMSIVVRLIVKCGIMRIFTLFPIDDASWRLSARSSLTQNSGWWPTFTTKSSCRAILICLQSITWGHLRLLIDNAGVLSPLVSAGRFTIASFWCYSILLRRFRARTLISPLRYRSRRQTFLCFKQG
jgi:hypothetical protein